jgi:glycosyltransferase involved in cell wall biosynthesis
MISNHMEIILALVTFNQSALLREFVERWREWGAERIPLLVVDDGSTDETAEVLRRFAHPHLTVIHAPHISISRARNLALAAATSEWIAFSDTDCRLDREYFAALVEIPSRFSDVAAVEGAVQFVPGPKPPFTHSLSNTGGSYATANMVYRVAEARDVGGFDEAFGNYREDSDLALTLLERGRAIPFWGALKVEHPHLPRAFWRSLIGAWSTQRRILRSEIRLYLKHPRGYSRLRHHGDAARTLGAWRKKYLAAYIKDCFRFWFREKQVDLRERIFSIPRSLQGLIVAATEQACIVVISMMEWKKITIKNET